MLLEKRLKNNCKDWRKLCRRCFGFQCGNYYRNYCFGNTYRWSRNSSSGSNRKFFGAAVGGYVGGEIGEDISVELYEELAE